MNGYQTNTINKEYKPLEIKLEKRHFNYPTKKKSLKPVRDG